MNITIPRETFDAMREALEAANIDNDEAYEDWKARRDAALSAAKAVQPQVDAKTDCCGRDEFCPDCQPGVFGEVQPQAQGETDYYADARTWYEWSTYTNWHAPKWDDFSPLGLARVEKQYQDARALEQAWRLRLRKSPLWANDGKTLNIFAAGFDAGRNYPQASEPDKSAPGEDTNG